MNGKKKIIYIIVSVALLLIVVTIAIFCLAQEKGGPYNVVFQDYDGTILKTESVKVGEGATAPQVHEREGYTFFEWDKDYSTITKDVIIKAEYVNNAETRFSVDTNTIYPDDSEVKVAVSVQNNPGILGMALSVDYDDQALTLLNAQSGTVLSALTFQEPSRFVRGCKFVWYGSETGEVLDGEILILTFKANENIESKKYPITISWNDRDIYDGNCDMLNPRVEQGGIVIAK